MHRAKKINLTDLNQQLTCKLCKGYFIDATTIIECLHSFCRSCIVKYLEKSKYCPVCDVQVHKTKPLLNIRPDQILQDIVYKLVPRLFQNELQRRKEFQASHPEDKTILEQYITNNQHIVTPDESISLTLSYYGCNSNNIKKEQKNGEVVVEIDKGSSVGTEVGCQQQEQHDNYLDPQQQQQHPPRRYLRCPAAVTIGHLQKLIRAKYGLKDNHHVDILHNQDCLNSSLTLIDVAYIYSWKRKSPIELSYRIYEYNNAVKKLKLNHYDNNNYNSCSSTSNNNNNNSNSDQKEDNRELTTCVQSNNNNNNNNWKEVQLRISENGEMSITGIQDEALELLNNNNNNDNSNNNNNIQKNKTTTNKKKEVPDLLKCVSLSNGPIAISNCSPLISNSTSTTTKTVYSTINSTKCSVGVVEDNNNKKDIIMATITGGSQQQQKNNNLTNNNNNNNNSGNNNSSSSSTSSSSNNDKKRKADVQLSEQPPNKQAKQTILNHTIGIHNLSNNHPLKKHSQLSIKNIDDKNNGIESTQNLPLLSLPPPPLPPISTTTTTKLYLNRNAPTINRPSTPTVTQSTTSPITTAKITNQKPCYMPKTPIINVPKPSTSNTNNSYDLDPKKLETTKPIINNTTTSITTTTSTTTTTTIINATTSGIQQTNKLIKSKASTPIGYKTLRDPPKSWNLQIAKANITNKTTNDSKYNDIKNVRPAKFFKMRNNLPRYLGNPASGVKPMYPVHNTSPDKDKQQLLSTTTTTPSTVCNITTTTTTTSTSQQQQQEIKKHSIVKIDPKTLKPISEKAPEPTSLSNPITTIATTTSTTTTNDLKINISSVSIFNPLKLQNSPKNDRKSPKSPHSPKLNKTINSMMTTQTTTTASTITSNKRDNKLNLNFTPSNPFVPNLASPTCSPNQFLYPHGFAPYDPRVMAAYHTLLYGQRMAAAYSPLGMDIGQPPPPPPQVTLTSSSASAQQQQKKSFEPPTSPKLGGLSASQISQSTSTKLASDLQLIAQHYHQQLQQQQQHQQHERLNSINYKNHNGSKRSGKESSGKNEKSLQSAVEKLTQNRVKESHKNETSTAAVTITTTPNVTSTISTTTTTSQISSSTTSASTTTSTTTSTASSITTPTTKEIVITTATTSPVNTSSTTTTASTIGVSTTLTTTATATTTTTTTASAAVTVAATEKKEAASEEKIVEKDLKPEDGDKSKTLITKEKEEEKVEKKSETDEIKIIKDNQKNEETETKTIDEKKNEETEKKDNDKDNKVEIKNDEEQQKSSDENDKK